MNEGRALTPQQKLAAIMDVAPSAALHMRPSDETWYVGGAMVEIGGDGLMSSPTQHAEHPLEAVDAWWQAYVTDLPEGRYLAAPRPRPRTFRWSGWGWKDIEP